jgi:hypothetical protein
MAEEKTPITNASILIALNKIVANTDPLKGLETLIVANTNTLPNTLPAILAELKLQTPLLTKIAEDVHPLPTLLVRLISSNVNTESQLNALILAAAKGIDLLQQIATAVQPPPAMLTSIRVGFKKGASMKFIPGPITLATAGEQALAGIIGYDQDGNEWTGPLATPFQLKGDNDAVATVDPESGIVTAVANGVMNLTGQYPLGDGTFLTDTETVTVSIVEVPPVLSSIKVGFAAVAKKKK